jgi:tRNA(Ile)-lysidine synthase
VEADTVERLAPFVGIEEKVDQAIRAHELLARGDRIVVAVSGGPDSVALFRCLVALRARWNWDLCVGHVDHGFRGADSEEDAKFVEGLAEKFGVPAMVSRLHLTKQHVRLKKRSLQEYARSARYHALEQMVHVRQATKLALGHTADDQAETVLMWMLRGCGTGGLRGIPPKRGTSLVRPLLEIQRSEIERYLQERQEVFRLDPTNCQPLYLRNRIRQDLIPHLKQYSAGIVNVLTRQARILRDDYAYLEEVADEAMQRTCMCESSGERHFDRSMLLNVPLPIRRMVVRKSLQEVVGGVQGARFDIVDRILDRLERGQSGWTIECNGVQVCQEYDRLVVCRLEQRTPLTMDFSSREGMPLPIPGEAVWFPTGQRITVSEASRPMCEDHVDVAEIQVDPATFTPELTVRRWTSGDTFCPKGLGGRKKKLQDFFSDMKLPRSLRTRVPLLVAPEGIVWIGGLRADERFRISASTTSVVVAKMTV